MALNQVSPGITVTEIDLTSSIPAFGVNTRGAIAGAFKWGPALSPTPVTSEVDLVSKFGAPDNQTANVFFTAASFLSYSTDLYVSRANAAGQLNSAANTGGDSTGVLGVYVPNETYYTSNTIYLNNGTVQAPNATFIARYPGAKGNSLEISICPSAAAFTGWLYKPYFDSAPGTSTYAEGKNSTGDELHIAVVDAGGLFSGTPGTILERFGYLSKASDARTDDGTTNYYKEVLLNKSKYILWANHPASTTTTHWGNTAVVTAGSFGAGSSNVTIRFEGGADGTVGATNLNNAYNVFADKENIDIDLIIGGDVTKEVTVANNILNIAATRKDCVTFISPTFADTFSDDPTTALVNRINNVSPRTSYGVMDSGWKYTYDKYNDTYRWVPLNGDIAGLCARTDRDRDPWYSPAGFSRGGIKNVVKLAYNPKKAERDTIYKAGINPVISLPGEGVLLFGDKTILSKPSSFDRINVRRLFITLEKAVERAARASLFEFNDQFTRSQFVSLVEPFLRTVQGRRGIYDFRVVCDETNNPGDVVDRNEFVGDIYVKPARSINFIQLNFVAVKTGVDFKEVVGKF